MKNILVYTHFFYPEVGAASVRIQYLVKSLLNAGFNVTVLTPKPNYGLSRNSKIDGNENIFNEAKIIYLPIFFTDCNSLIGRFISYLSYFLFSFLKGFFVAKKMDCIITTTPPIFTAFSAAIISKIRKKNLILDIRDIWPDIGIELGIINNSFVIKGLKKIENFILRNSKKILVTAKGDQRNIFDKGISENKISQLYNGADTEIFDILSESGKQNVREKYNLPLNKKILVYFGSYNHGMNDINVLGESLANLNEYKDKIHFLSIGYGSNRRNLISKIEGKIEYTLIDSAESTEISKLIAASDLSLIPRKSLEKDTGGNIPVKCFESWACGIPVLLSSIKNCEVADIFNECRSGKLVEPADSELFSQSIIDLVEDKNLDELGKKGRDFVVKRFDRRKQSKKIIDIIKELDCQ